MPWLDLLTPTQRKLFVVTESPRDFPGLVVVRQHTPTDAGTVPAREPLIVCNTVPAARKILHATYPLLRQVPRTPQDDPVIVESWT